MTRKTNERPNFEEKLALFELLKQRLHPVEGTDKFRYEEGWDDEVVAKTVNTRLEANATAFVRKESKQFGLLIRQSSASSATTKTRVTALEEKLNRLIAILALHHAMSHVHRVWVDGGEGKINDDN